MSVTVEQLLKLPSLNRAKVVGGHGGLSKVVSSISVLESTDPGLLVDEVFPQGEFFGSEIVITGFLNSVDNVPLQLANIRRLAEGGEVGLIVFYVGVYLPCIDPRLIALADELDFVLITMPEGDATLRYGEVINDVMDCIYRDRTQSSSVVLDILAGVSALPKHLQTVNTALRMLSDRISASVLLCDSSFHLLNLVAWPRGIEAEVAEGFKAIHTLPPPDSSTVCPFVPDSRIYRMSLGTDSGQHMELLLIKAGLPFDAATLSQVLDATRICINIWGRRHGEIAIHELIRAILQDEPLKMRHLAEIFHVDVASLHEMWIVQSCAEDAKNDFQALLPTLDRVFAGFPGSLIYGRIWRTIAHFHVYAHSAGSPAAEHLAPGNGDREASRRGALPLLRSSEHCRRARGLSQFPGESLRRHADLSCPADLYLWGYQLRPELPPGDPGG